MELSTGVTWSLMILSMICWGSWANTFKLTQGVRFELFYWDYAIGLALMALLAAVVVGRYSTAAGFPARVARGLVYLVPNETEASQLRGMPVETVSDAKQCATWLHQQGMACVVITLGAQDCVVADEQSVRHIPAYRVTAIDTTGAGDAFIGCLAASLAIGRSRDEAIRRAVIYSAVSTTKRGALVSYPTGEAARSLWT